MWVSRTAVRPTRVVVLDGLDHWLSSVGVEVRAVERLAPLRPVWASTLHASGIRLRSAVDWGKPGWTHPKPGRDLVLQDLSSGLGAAAEGRGGPR